LKLAVQLAVQLAARSPALERAPLAGACASRLACEALKALFRFFMADFLEVVLYDFTLYIEYI
jgi:hypothetical protein